MELHFVIFALCTGITVIAGQVMVLEDPRSWQEARNACQEKGEAGSCDLITRQKLNEKWSDTGLSGSEHFWVGGQRFYQWFWQENSKPRLPLFQRDGCYGATVEDGDVINMDFNGPYQCLPNCNADKFIYLQEQKCHCSSARKGGVVSRDSCDVTCNGSNDTCGGKNEIFSVYSLPSSIAFEEEDMSYDCAFGRLSGTTADDYLLSIQATNCERYHHYFCLSDLQEDTVPSRLEKYDTAVTRCGSDAKGNSSLPTVTDYFRTGQLLDDFKVMLDKLGISDSAFWLPLQRHTSAVWVDGEEAEQGGQPGACIAATPRTASYRLNDVPCVDKHRAICYCANGMDSDGDSDAKKPELDGKLKTIAIVIVVVVLLIVCVVAAVMFFLRRRRSTSDMDFEKHNNPVYRN
ncbi:uncharacterized protein [Littorina saxatilis]|uniref:Uncharacterized protein n=1 Tax=Littorina saxatilis TaxID=31220 RepID=A0AAN9BLB2_9CAEN